MYLPKALMQSLQCPLLSPGAGCCQISPRLHRRRAQRPVWREGDKPGDGDGSGAFYTVRTINGREHVVKRASSAPKRVVAKQ
jgi:hypothetical protein